MLIQAGYELQFQVQQPRVPMLLRLTPSTVGGGRIVAGGDMRIFPELEPTVHRDQFGNSVTRICPGDGPLCVTSDVTLEVSGEPDVVQPDATQRAVEELPEAMLRFLLPSRYCEVDGPLNDFAWRSFSGVPAGWARVQAVCDFVHRHLRFDYAAARATRTAEHAFVERTGVCRDFTHLAITLCRCLNIPARYAAGYLGDIGVPPLPSPMDFSAWFEAYLGDDWYTFDARFNVPRIGRVVLARGRDAADVAFLTQFGSARLTSFKVWTDEMAEPANAELAA